MPLSPEDKKNLVKLARNSISLYFKNQETEKPHFIERFGVFVNIEKNNKLRGSIGFPDPKILTTWSVRGRNARLVFFPIPTHGAGGCNGLQY